MKTSFLILLFLLSSLNQACFKEIEKEPAAKPSVSKILFSGTIDLAKDVKDKADPLAVIFVMARTPEGRLAAAKKLLPPFQYPLAFSITAEDLMIPGMDLPREYQPSARLDIDANANPPQPGDIIGKAEPSKVASGETGVKILLQEIVH